MEQIIQMTFLGIVAGAFSGFWTRIIKKNMIFRKFGKRLEKYNNRHVLVFGRASLLVKFIRCMFCFSVWLALALELFYILEYNPWWLYCVIGTLGGLGAGNLVCEVVHALRNEG